MILLKSATTALLAFAFTSASTNAFTRSTSLAAPTVPVLPLGIGSTLPLSATSFLTQEMNIGPNGTRVLVHIWGATRPNTPSSLNNYNRFTASPFCVDVFEREAAQGKKAQWKLMASAAYLATDPPKSLVAHWLHPKTKSGPMLEIIYGNGAPGVSTQHTILTWEKGFQAAGSAPAQLTLATGGSGGGLISTHFQTDQRGYTSVVLNENYVGKLQKTQVYFWMDGGFSSVKNPL